jgi:hypothetical protein
VEALLVALLPLLLFFPLLCGRGSRNDLLRCWRLGLLLRRRIHRLCPLLRLVAALVLDLGRRGRRELGHRWESRRMRERLVQ